MSNSIRTFGTHDELYRSAASDVADAIIAAVRFSGRCSIALSGGTTPVRLHELLATDFAHRVPWGSVHVFWGDERYVPHDSPHSNYGMARRTLLDHVPCPPGNVHPMPTNGDDPARSALEYEHTLQQHFGTDVPRFNIMLLGMGSDGHIASLFPGSSALLEEDRRVLAVTAEAEVPRRLTLTLPVIRRSELSFVIVTGSSKASAVKEAISPHAELIQCPAAALQQTEGEVRWWLDLEAAGE